MNKTKHYNQLKTAMHHHTENEPSLFSLLSSLLFSFCLRLLSVSLCLCLSVSVFVRCCGCGCCVLLCVVSCVVVWCVCGVVCGVWCVVCPLSTSPCVRSKRPRVYRHHAPTCDNMCACPHTLPRALATLPVQSVGEPRKAEVQLCLSHFVMSKAWTAFAYRDTVRVQTIMRDERCLFCGNVSDVIPCLPSPHTPHMSLATSPSWRQYRQRSGLQWCSLCPGCHLLQLSCCKCPAARCLQPLDHEVLPSTRSTEEDT